MNARVRTVTAETPVGATLTTAMPSFAMAWKSLLLDQRVPSSAVRLYLLLATYARPGRPVAFPGQDRLAAELNCSVDTIQRSGQVLVQTGWIRKVRRGRGRTNLYHLLMPPPVSTPGANDPDPIVDEAVYENDDTADLRLLETASMRLPYEVEEDEVENPPNPPRGAGVAVSTRRGKAPLTDAEGRAAFDAWWETYPRKVGKLTAESAWRRLLQAGRLPDRQTLLDATAAMTARVAREHPNTEDRKRYTPHPSTWLNRGGWLDENEGDPIDTPVDNPTLRHPCVLCGIAQPTQAKCMGPAKGLIDTADDCIWRES